MTTLQQIVGEFADLDTEDLLSWIERGWVRPSRTQDSYEFTAADHARVRLIWEMRYELSIDYEAMPVVLSLLDQVYGLRHQLRSLDAAVGEQPPEVRESILRLMASRKD